MAADVAKPLECAPAGGVSAAMSVTPLQQPPARAAPPRSAPRPCLAPPAPGCGEVVGGRWGPPCARSRATLRARPRVPRAVGPSRTAQSPSGTPSAASAAPRAAQGHIPASGRPPAACARVGGAQSALMAPLPCTLARKSPPCALCNARFLCMDGPTTCVYVFYSRASRALRVVMRVSHLSRKRRFSANLGLLTVTTTSTFSW